MEIEVQLEAARRRGCFAGRGKIACTILLCLLLAGCGQELPATQAAAGSVDATGTATASPAPSHMPTATPRSTQTTQAQVSTSATPSPSPLPPTASATATSTARPTHTATPPPTFTPAAPDDTASYQLEAWTPARATALIARLEAFPDTLEAEARGSSDSNYYQAFAPAALAQEEGLLRFPDAPEASGWRWGLAYNYVRTGDLRAAAAYARLLEGALNTGESSPDSLPAWFAQQESRLTLSPAGAADGYRLFQLALTTPGGEAISGSYLLLAEAEGTPRFYTLTHRNAFDPATGAGLSAGFADVTGDGREELITVQAHRPGVSGSFYFTDFLVYQLFPLPPRRLPFFPTPNTHLGWGSDDGWQVVDVDGSQILRLREQPAERCEAVSTVTDYLWTGERMQQLKRVYEIGDSASGSRYCLPFIFTAAEEGHEGALQYLEETIYRGGPDQADEWRYRLGLYHTLAGNDEAATRYFDELIADPRGTNRTWVRAAASFLAQSRTPAGLYPACAAAEQCNPNQALRHLVEQIPSAAYALAPAQLRAWGVPVTRSGFFDMEGDGTLEQWLLVGNGVQFNFWVLVPAGGRLDALFVDTIGGSAYAARLDRLTAVAGVPVIQLDNGRERILFAFAADPAGSSEPLATVLRSQSANESANYTAQFLADSQVSLWQGASPALVATNLNRFRQSAEFDCNPGGLRPLCAEYGYTEGLAQELAGEPIAATALYLALWRQYPDTPYATMARARLLPSLPPTATPAP